VDEAGTDGMAPAGNPALRPPVWPPEE
jgi:hypothetical protein